jgi:hypothetical protein
MLNEWLYEAPEVRKLGLLLKLRAVIGCIWINIIVVVIRYPPNRMGSLKILEIVVIKVFNGDILFDRFTIGGCFSNACQLRRL